MLSFALLVMLASDRLIVLLQNTLVRIFCMTATSGFLAALECTKFVFGRGSAPEPSGGAYSAPPDHLAGLKGTYF